MVPGRESDGKPRLWKGWNDFGQNNACMCARMRRRKHPTGSITFQPFQSFHDISKKDISSMTSPNSISGRIAANASEDGSITFEGVQERLVEAWGFLRRMPDREAGWLMDVRASSIYERGQLSRQELWELYQIDSADYDRDALPRMPGLRSVEVDRMEQALGWMGWVDARDRKLVGIILGQLERGASRPAWASAAKSLGSTAEPDTLRKRYSRGITRIAMKLDKVGNGCFARLEHVKP